MNLRRRCPCEDHPAHQDQVGPAGATYGRQAGIFHSVGAEDPLARSEDRQRSTLARALGGPAPSAKTSHKFSGCFGVALVPSESRTRSACGSPAGASPSCELSRAFRMPPNAISRRHFARLQYGRLLVAANHLVADGETDGAGRQYVTPGPPSRPSSTSGGRRWVGPAGGPPNIGTTSRTSPYLPFFGDFTVCTTVVRGFRAAVDGFTNRPLIADRATLRVPMVLPPFS